MDLKSKTSTFKIEGLWATKRVPNHKAIPIYNLYKVKCPAYCPNNCLQHHFQDFIGIPLKFMKWRIAQIQFKDTLEKPVPLSQFLLGEGTNQKCKNMWSFAMAYSN